MTEHQNINSSASSSASGSIAAPTAAPEATRPWWREPVMWWVVGGPSLVVVASFITLGLALRYPDPVLQEQASAKAMQPAKEARNHAATGGK
ncbi:hypothetical protein LNV09_08185 [Paucibacter sp. B2R-40]|uniref:hypothetical protein n=1 Tax=Paucibacter sp. B2R-40 TaxID=2893554 RepID=UPI0021E4C41A|nr:hypothetical protein [Paucibacter sp. B2R-40]MCV2354144.1 hypothetical protein [Paucibacter sp. B2R-40]